MKKTILLVIISIFSITCYPCNTTNKSNSTEVNTQKKKTEKEKLNDEGWSELARIDAISENSLEERRYLNTTSFTIFFKDKYYCAVRHKDHTSSTRFSVTKGEYEICGKSFDGRISYYGTFLYFNF